MNPMTTQGDLSSLDHLALLLAGPSYEVIASNPRLNRKVTGTVTVFVDGVPAEAVHSFVWDGDGSVSAV